ncbi:MAG TPA: TIGR02680 family protein [Terriglobia bacterium]|jgi:uncharacterized protein (TIGR02680 family)
MSRTADSENDSSARPLPAAQNLRWQPVRSGLLNIYKYDREEFHYEKGRLLLRGNNGTGKSRVLALQLPFLLEGETAAHRLEPDADAAKRIEWNLLMGRYTERTGYTWIEFGRRDDAGQQYFLTLGCGLSATEGRSGVNRWFFITAQRIGRDLHLENEFRQPLGKDRLHDAIGTHGSVFGTAGEYRKAVDQALFRLGEYRYPTLLNLLVKLRRPQLTRHLDEKDLSSTLSEALQPVSPAILSEVAEAFRNLEADRLQLESYTAAERAVAEFLRDYRRYLQIAAKRRADSVRSAQSAYEARMRDINKAESDIHRVTQALASASQRIEEIKRRETEIESEIATLLESPQMKDAQALDQAVQEASRREHEAETAKDELGRAGERKRERDRQKAEAAGRAEQASRQLQSVSADAAKKAEQAGLGAAHSAAELQKEFIEQAAQAQRRKAAHIRKLNSEIESSRQKLTHAAESETNLRGILETSLDEQRQFRSDLLRASTKMAASFSEWLLACIELRIGNSDAVAGSLAEWCESGDGPNPVSEAVRAAEAEAGRLLADSQAALLQQRSYWAGKLSEWESEYERLGEGSHLPPPAPHTRDEASRINRPGAPLWLVCDFVDGIDPRQRAGIEAALEASGLLDAWVTPEGTLFDAEIRDTLVTAGQSPLPPEDSHVGHLLAPSIDPADSRAATVSGEAVRAVLLHIGAHAGSGHIWVDPNGTWQLGPLRGSWSKPEVRHIGHSARETARLQRMAEIAAEIKEVRLTIAGIDRAFAQMVLRRETLRREAVAAPSDDEIRNLHARLGASARAIAELRERVMAAEQRTSECRLALAQSIEKRDADASDLGISEWADRIQELEDAIGAYLQTLAALWPTLEMSRQLAAEAERAGLLAAEAREFEERQEQTYRDASLSANAAVAARDTLERSVGATAREITDRLEAARKYRSGIRKDQEESVDRKAKLESELSGFQTALMLHKQEFQNNTSIRDESIRWFKAFAETRLLHLAVSSLDDVDASSWSTTRAIENARETAAVLSEIDSSDAVWERNQNKIAGHFQEISNALLAQYCRPAGLWSGDVFVATVTHNSMERSIEELRGWLIEEVSTRQSLLQAREREILENHLIGEVSGHLHDLLHTGEALIRDMNAELEARPTSTGMKLRFVWKAREDGPAGLPEARQRLMRSTATWSVAERQMLGSFLQEQIRVERAETDAATWQESLTDALDYRKWHYFGVERSQDGQWKPLTKRTHGTGSGGEKAIALTLPQFAAAAAYYRSANPLAPRLILLDEAFAGIDTDMRAKCMGFLESFDLDFIMTSEREWACYSTLRGVAIYQLSTRPGIDAVCLTRWVWNGNEKVRDG